MTTHVRRLLVAVTLALVFASTLSAQTPPPLPTAGRLDRALRAAGIPIVGVSIGTEADRATWVIQYDEAATVPQRAAGEALRLVFDPLAAAVLTGELDAQILQTLDNERLISAVVWAVIDTFATPATIAKYNTARTRIISAYKLQPWKP